MMTTIQIRIDKKTKDSAKKAFAKMGLDLSSGIKVYLARVVEDQCVPFQLHIPNEETVKALKDSAAGKGKVFDSVDALFRDALGKDYKKLMRGHEKSTRGR